MRSGVQHRLLTLCWISRLDMSSRWWGWTRRPLDCRSFEWSGCCWWWCSDLMSRRLAATSIHSLGNHSWLLMMSKWSCSCWEMSTEWSFAWLATTTASTRTPPLIYSIAGFVCLPTSGLSFASLSATGRCLLHNSTPTKRQVLIRNNCVRDAFKLILFDLIRNY